jgi:hypothetical protein
MPAGGRTQGKSLALTGMLSANALPDGRWQSVQWQV